MSAHIVLTVPAQFCKDISGGSLAYQQATDQLLPLMAILESLLGPRGNTAAFSQWFTGGAAANVASTYLSDNGTIGVVGSTKAYTADHPLIRGALGFRPLADLEYGQLIH
nr:MAG: hypothetical protein 2 [Leviviridae sp.]